MITGSYDSTVKFWDLAAGKCQHTLTYHKKGVRALALHPREFTLLSASADNIKKFALPNGRFMHNMLSQKSIVNSLSVNEDDVVVSGGDNGSLYFWDYKSGHNFQQAAPKVQPGSMESEAGIFASAFDRTGNPPDHRGGGQDDQNVEGGRGRHARDASQPGVPPAARPSEVLDTPLVMKFIRSNFSSSNEDDSWAKQHFDNPSHTGSGARAVVSAGVRHRRGRRRRDG